MKVSVAMCTYNGEKFLREQLNSILQQTVSVDEIVICDDRSTDHTFEILKEYQQKYPAKIRLYLNEENLRSVKNFEKAIRLCTNDIIFLSDQDDVWLPEKVETVWNYFEKNPNIQVVDTNGFGINENSERLDVLTIWDIISIIKNKNSKFDDYKTLAFVSNFATGAAMAFRKEFLQEILPIPVVEQLHHDEWIALMASAQKKFYFLDQKLFKYRSHSQQLAGGVFYQNTPKEIQKQTNLFDLYNENRDFEYYKNILKRLAESYHKNKKILSTKPTRRYIFENNINEAKNLFFTFENELKKKYPTRYFLLKFADKFSGKRKL